MKEKDNMEKENAGCFSDRVLKCGYCPKGTKENTKKDGCECVDGFPYYYDESKKTCEK